MRITESRLRRIIREEMVNESITRDIGSYFTNMLTPASITRIQKLSETAATRLFPNEHYTRMKGFRHIYACALLTITLGEGVARSVGNLNELKGAIRVAITTAGKKFESGIAMDLKNNEIGIDIGLEALEKFKGKMSPRHRMNRAQIYSYESSKKKANDGDFFYTDTDTGKTGLYSQSSGYMTSVEANDKAHISQ